MPCRRWNSYTGRRGASSDHRRNRERVVSRELRIDHIGRGKQSLRTYEIAGIGRGFGGITPESREPAFLRTLDLACPSTRP